MWLSKFERYNGWLTFTGCLVLMLGLCLDELIHRLFSLAGLGENLFSLSNPGHLLIMLGVAFLILNSEIFLIGCAWRLRYTDLFKSAYLFMAAVWLVGLSLLGLLLTVSGSSTVSHF